MALSRNTQVRVNTSRRGGRGFVCPWCDDGKGRYGLGINLNSGAVSCWKCGPHGWAETLAALAGIPYQQARERLKGVAAPYHQRRRTDVRGKLVEPYGVADLTPAHRRYLAGRGFDVGRLEKLWGVRGIAQAPRCAWSVYVPIRFGGELVSWTTRKIGGNGNPRRYTAAEFPGESVLPRERFLYGWDYVRNSVVVVEGPTDVWAVGPGAAGTLGTGFSRRHVALISRVPLRAILFDNNRQAQERAAKLAAEVAPFPGRTFILRTTTGPDPASSDPRELRMIRQKYLDLE